MHVRFSDVTIVGLGKSGLSAALFLLDRGCNVSVTDRGRSPKVLERAELLKKQSARVECGVHTREWIQGRALVIVSPGVPRDSTPICWAREYGIPMIGELEMAARFFPGKIIAVTGTNGKSTVTTLIGEVLRRGGHTVRVGGNLGTPFTELIAGSDSETIAVVEVSSFQLETIDSFKPWISVFLNLTPNHLDRYGHFSLYRDAKLRIFENQTHEDWAVVGQDVQGIDSIRARVRKVSNGKHVNPNKEIVRTVANIVGIPAKCTQDALDEFNGLEHRLEFSGTIGGVHYFNDSKSTNTASTLWAIERVRGRGVWILGGRDKGADFTVLRAPLQERARGIVAMGEAGSKIRAALAGSLQIEPAANLRDAFERARTLAHPGDHVVLSPACASFDEFSCFEERGKAFKVLVRNATA